jgi:hypothetical protein
MDPKRVRRLLLILAIGSAVVSLGETVGWIWALLDPSDSTPFEEWYPPVLIVTFGLTSIFAFRARRSKPE